MLKFIRQIILLASAVLWVLYAMGWSTPETDAPTIAYVICAMYLFGDFVKEFRK